MNSSSAPPEVIQVRPRSFEMDSNRRQRTEPMKVICPGMSRSGTNSMWIALEKLGIGKTWHGFRFEERPEESKLWMDLIERKWPSSGRPSDIQAISRADFDRILWDFAATCDCPPAVFWQEMMAAYPEAKIVLVERDADAWYRSFATAILDRLISLQGRIAAQKWFAWYTNVYSIRTMTTCYLKYFQARNSQDLQAKLRSGYIEHNEAIRRACRQQGRPLLDYKLGSGLRPLCEFLDIEVPQDLEFPQSNESAVTVQVLRDYINGLVASTMISLLTRSAAGVGLGAAAWIAWRNPELIKVWTKHLSFR